MRRTVLAVLAVVMALVLASCSTSSKPAASSSGATFTTIDEAHPITAGAPINPFNPAGNTFDSYDQMELGYPANSAANPNAYFPAIAKSWTTVDGGSALDVEIQPKARWSNGTEVTAADVKLSTAIAFTQGTQPSNLSGVTILSPKEIRFNTIPGSQNQLFIADVLDITVVPTSVYAREVPADIWSIIKAEEYTGTNKALQKEATAAEAKLTTIGKKISAFGPAKDVSAGPFVLERLNPGEALLVKNKYFFDASKISPTQVVMRNYTGNEQIWSYLISGQLSAAPFTAMPNNVLHEILSTKGNEKVTSPSFVAASLAFNEKDYPWGILDVRKAMAYLLNRTEIAKVGEGAAGIPAEDQTGTIDSIVPEFLSSSQIAALNPYRYSPSTAASLLRTSGFTERGGKWYLPDGKPFTITIETVSGFSDWIAAGSYMAAKLSGFGIPTTSSIASSYAAYLTNLAAGDYAVGFWLTALGPSVVNAYDRIWGTDDGFTAVGDTTRHAATGDWLNTPTTYTLPHYGTINPGQLTTSLNFVSPARAKSVVAELSAAADEELPMIALWDYINVQFVNTNDFTDFPIGHPGLLDDPPGVWMWNGFVHAK
jgi:peptide/nickel transport system substrate-binding protein